MIKIGQSKDRYRQDELYTTGVPTKFRVEYYALVNNYIDIEKRVHNLLRQYRPNKNREFFNCTTPLAIITIRQNSIIHNEYVYYKSPEEVEDERIRQEEIEQEREIKRKKDRFVEEIRAKKRKQEEEIMEFRYRESRDNLVRGLVAAVVIIVVFWFMIN